MSIDSLPRDWLQNFLSGNENARFITLSLNTSWSSLVFFHTHTHPSLLTSRFLPTHRPCTLPLLTEVSLASFRIHIPVNIVFGNCRLRHKVVKISVGIFLASGTSPSWESSLSFLFGCLFLAVILFLIDKLLRGLKRKIWLGTKIF